MNPEIKQKWLDALRSGKYAQTKRVLRDDDGMCCLGVLLDVIEPDGWGSKVGCGTVPCYAHVNGTTQADFPREGFKHVHGLGDWATCPVRGSRHSVGHILSYLNDHANWDFKQIADWIEDKL